MKRNSNEREVSYPSDLIDNKKLFPLNSAIPCSILAGNEVVGGVFIVCSSKEIKHFNIMPSSSPALTVNYRMLDYGKLTFAVEICMLFGKDLEKNLKLHLNPHDKRVKELLKLCSETNIISFHFYNKDTDLLSSVVGSIQEHEASWIDRNYKLSTKLVSDDQGYESLAAHLSEGISSADRVFEYFTMDKCEFFVRDGRLQVAIR